MPSSPTIPVVLAGVPVRDAWLYRRVPFAVGDPLTFTQFPDGERVVILRDIEMDRAREMNIAEHIHAPRDFAPESGLSPDRETATAQALAEMLRRRGVPEVVTNRSLPMIFAHAMQEAGVRIVCDPELDVLDRRGKSEREVDALRQAQRLTEQVVRLACEMIGSATAAGDGGLWRDAEPLTSERVKAEINIALLKRGMGPSESIVAGGPQGADCHHRGAGQLYTGQPIIIDVFPMDPRTRYWGDCTRCVVHGRESDIPPVVRDMHAAVVDAKWAAIDASRVGVTGEAVHQAACDVLAAKGYAIGLPEAGATDDAIHFVHGTGHGVGLDVHEPPLLDRGGPPLVKGDCLTIEPGLYCKAIGGIRVEDMVIVNESGCENLNTLPEGLTWA